ncbi:MAG: hypothetical protein OXB94_14195, partial [Nitrospira sp.]|nr:hypothetical protein [Nitrospira sp.]
RVPGPMVRVPGPMVRVPGPMVRVPGPMVRVPGPMVRVPGPMVRVPGPVVRVPVLESVPVPGWEEVPEQRRAIPTNLLTGWVSPRTGCRLDHFLPLFRLQERASLEPWHAIHLRCS